MKITTTIDELTNLYDSLTDEEKKSINTIDDALLLESEICKNKEGEQE